MFQFRLNRSLGESLKKPNEEWKRHERHLGGTEDLIEILKRDVAALVE